MMKKTMQLSSTWKEKKSTWDDIDSNINSCLDEKVSLHSYQPKTDLKITMKKEKRITEVGPLNWLKVCFVPTKSDALIVGFRRWLKKYSGGHVDWGSKFQTLLPPSVPREQLMDRYWSHVVHCKSCSRALGGLKALEVSLQVVSILSLGIVAVVRQNAMSTLSRSVVASAAVLFFLASRWLSHFIFKNFYYHDYDHAFK